MSPNQKPVRKAVSAAAGVGTRFLPQTKAMPKEMLPLIDKPIIQYIVEDLVAAGIKDIIIVGSSNKRSIEDHFDVPSEDLLNNLRAGGEKKQPYITQVEAIANLANFVYIRQKGPYGTATPVLNAAHLIGDEPFIYAFADDLTVGSPNAFQQLIAHYQQHNGVIIPSIRATQDIDYDRYGMLGGQQISPGVLKVDHIVEKPGKANAPSDFAAVGGYLLTPEVFEFLEVGLKTLSPGREFYLTDEVIEPMITAGHPVYGTIIEGKRYDTGDKLEYLKTIVDFALANQQIGDEFRMYLKRVVQ
jgi:UTP--glucose-1-phosphate uridylyltransferase